MINALKRFDRRKKRDSFKVRSKCSDNGYVVSILKSNKHISIILENSVGIHLSAATSKTKDNSDKIDLAQLVNQFVQKIIDLKIDLNAHFIFNKCGYVFHGNVAKVAFMLCEKGVKCS